MSLTFLGQSVHQPVQKLETFDVPQGLTEITLIANEVTSLCPVTKQPDFETVTITYAPRQMCIESKSLKLYLWSFRDEGLFCEELAVKIHADICRACDPLSCTVIVEQNSRGGISIRAIAK